MPRVAAVKGRGKPFVGSDARSKSWPVDELPRIEVSMRAPFSDTPNGRELIDELDAATAQMMAMSADLIGSAEWQLAAERQYCAFRKWREYLHRMADGRVLVDAEMVA